MRCIHTTLRYATCEDWLCVRRRTRQGSLFLSSASVLCDTASPLSPATGTHVLVTGLIPGPAAEHRTRCHETFLPSRR